MFRLPIVLSIIILLPIWQYSHATSAFLATDKDEVSLGDDLTIMLAEPDANIDSRSMERIPLAKIFLTTDKFDETSLDKVLSRTGISINHPFLQETGFNTGVFEITLESISSNFVSRGSRIQIIYFDETPAGSGSAIRVQTVIPVVEGKIAIIFDKHEYSVFGTVEIKLIADMFNINRNKIDTINTPTGSRVAVTASSGETYYPPMFETGLSTGTFIGKLQLTSDQNEKKGDLVVRGGDRIKVTVSIVPGFEVSDLATITTTLGSIEFDKATYSIGDSVKITVNDMDENKDSSAIDTVQARVWSNTSIKGLVLALQETEVSSGVFEGILTISSDWKGIVLEGDTLLVSDNDILIAQYGDRTVPSLTKAKMENVFAKAAIGSARETVLSDPVILDQNGLKIAGMRIGDNATIQASITNAKTLKQTFVYVTRISDSEGFTSFISFVTGTFEPYQSISIGHNWIPDRKDTYTIEVLLWSSLEEPIVFSPIKKTIVEVK
jgi:hypothetical protein